MTLLVLSLVLAAGSPPSPVAALDRKLDAALATARAHADDAAASTSPAAVASANVPTGALAVAPAAARDRPAAAPLTLRPAERSTTGIGGVLLLGALGGAAWWAKRKRGAREIGLRLVQHTGLGKGRSLVVVEHGGRRLLLGVTGSSIAVLRDDEAPGAPTALETAHADLRPLSRGIAAFEQELTRASAPSMFEPTHGGDPARAELLAPRSEDEALRRKLGKRESAWTEMGRPA